MEQQRRFPSWIFSITLLILLVFGFVKRWDIYDAWRLHNYTAPAQFVTLASDTAMNEKTRRLLYVNHPVIEDKTPFHEHCARGEQTIVLGCFAPFRGIYLLNVSDDRLHGVEQVTAAHETLHAAYQRLSPAEKKKVNGWLNDQFTQLNDERIKATIEDYRKNGDDVNNELHSILGTEVAQLSPELEAYYKRYFTDRSRVVGYSEEYEKAFTTRKAQVAAYDKQLEQIKVSIDSHNAALQTKEAQLNAAERNLQQLKRSNDVQAYNAAVPGYNALVQSYNDEVAVTRNLIDQYNAILKSLQSIELEERELVKAIDSRPETIKSE